MLNHATSAANLLLLLQGNEEKFTHQINTLKKKLEFVVSKYKALELKNMALEKRLEALEKKGASQ